MLNIFVTGIGGGGVGEQIIKALRLSNLTFRLFGADTTRISKGIKEVDEFFELVPASNNSYITDLIDICISRKINVLFPGSEPELKVISRHRDKFLDAGVQLFINPDAVLEICLDKTKTSQFLIDNELHSPRYFPIREESGLHTINDFPVVLKPSVGGGGSANIMIAQNRDELLLFGKYLLALYPEFIVQEYVGNSDNEFTVGVLLDMNGEIINSIAIKRIIDRGLGSKIKVPNKSGRSDLGPYLQISSGISQGLVCERFLLNELCEEMALRLGARSSINIQCRLVDDKPYVFEINPRYSGTTSLRALVGYNEPEVLINTHLLNKPVERHFNFNSGYILRGLQEVYLGSLS